MPDGEKLGYDHSWIFIAMASPLRPDALIALLLTIIGLFAAQTWIQTPPPDPTTNIVEINIIAGHLIIKLPGDLAQSICNFVVGVIIYISILPVLIIIHFLYQYFTEADSPRYGAFRSEFERIRGVHLDWRTRLPGFSVNDNVHRELMIENILLEVRVNFCYLLRSNYVRAALFTPFAPNNKRTNPSMRLIYSNSFLRRGFGPGSSEISFTRGQGFCGTAWQSMRPEMGGKWLIRYLKTDPRYYANNISPWESKSFIAIPIINRKNDENDIIAILCVDSTNAKDFSGSRKKIDRIFEAIWPVLELMEEYIR